MGDWQPIETAPPNRQVLMGRWQKSWMHRGEPEWWSEVGEARETWLFGLLVRKTYDGRKYSHWKPLPDPNVGGEDNGQ